MIKTGFATIRHMSGISFEIAINFRSLAWFKICCKVWREALIQNWCSPVFWLYITPRFIVRMARLALVG